LVRHTLDLNPGSATVLLPPPRALGTQATAAALRLGLSATVGQSQARRWRLPLPPLASRLRPRLRLSAHWPATLRARVPLTSRLWWTVDGAWPLALAAAPCVAGGQREPATAAPPRRSRCFGSAYAPKRRVTRPLSAEAR
jgi:hypothetical protein